MNGAAGKGRTMSKTSPKEFAKLFAEFNTALQEEHHKFRGDPGRPSGVKIDDQEQIVELFRIWYFDSREQELLEEAREREAEERGF